MVLASANRPGRSVIFFEIINRVSRAMSADAFPGRHDRPACKTHTPSILILDSYVLTTVARFSSTQNTKTGENIPNCY
jgi:hypothetical protein